MSERRIRVWGDGPHGAYDVIGTVWGKSNVLDGGLLCCEFTESVPVKVGQSWEWHRVLYYPTSHPRYELLPADEQVGTE